MGLHHDHHAHEHRLPTQRGYATHLFVALGVTLVFALVEAVAGWWSGSLALLGDAGHMVSDATALGLAVLAAWLARRGPSAKYSYGLGRAEVLAALLNALLMMLIVGGLVVTALKRLEHPQPVTGGTVMVIAFIGLLVNLVVAWVLSRGARTLNTRAAFLHVLGDALGSVAALASGAVIYFTGWTPIDPLLTIFICALILWSSLRLLGEVMHVLLEGVPPEITLTDVGRAMAAVPGVISIHDLHIWSLSSGAAALSAHVVVRKMESWDAILAQLRALLHVHYTIHHVTLQPELLPEVRLPLPRGAKNHSLIG